MRYWQHTCVLSRLLSAPSSPLSSLPPPLPLPLYLSLAPAPPGPSLSPPLPPSPRAHPFLPLIFSFPSPPLSPPLSLSLFVCIHIDRHLQERPRAAHCRAQDTHRNIARLPRHSYVYACHCVLVCVCMPVYIYKYIYTYICMRVCLYVCMYYMGMQVHVL